MQFFDLLVWSSILGLFSANQLIWGYLLDSSTDQVRVQDSPRFFTALNGFIVALGVPVTLPLGLGILFFAEEREVEELEEEWRKQKLKRKIEREQRRREADIDEKLEQMEDV